MKCMFLPGLLLFLISCGQSNTAQPESARESGDTLSSKVEAAKIFDYPVLYKKWHMGDHDNARMVLQMYKAWDGKAIADMKSLIADSMIIDLPSGVRRAGGKDEMINRLLKTRETYASAANDILAIYPMVNESNNDQWVNVLVYNKWTYKDKVRDSMLFMDLWKIKDGKINYLMSLEQTPSRMGLKRLESLTTQK